MNKYFLRVLIVLGVFFCGMTTKGDPVPEPKTQVILGSLNATNKVIMYFSLDCTHCRVFVETILPKIREEFIDTGKLCFIMRDIPITPAGLLASKVARVRGEKHFFETIRVLISEQNTWNVTDGYSLKLREAAYHAGLSPAEFEKSLGNADLESEVLLARLAASQIREVPTFIVNGTTIKEDLTLERLRTLVK